MKYIRTKDGIFEKITDDYGWEIPVYANNDFYQMYIQEDDVIKQADTIEELCDEFVVANEEETTHIVYKNLAEARHKMCVFEKETHYQIDFIVYGAIWTNKGLIYVAKMNEKGEMELL